VHPHPALVHLVEEQIRTRQTLIRRAAPASTARTLVDAADVTDDALVVIGRDLIWVRVIVRVVVGFVVGFAVEFIL
jgi:hypothetical protein